MRNFILIFLILSMPLSCKRGSDVFAVFNNGDITRLEFNDWLESRNIPAEPVYKDKIALSDYLRQMAVEELTAIRAVNSGHDRNITYKTIENTLHKNLLATFFKAKRKEGITFNEKAADLSIIRVFYKNVNSAEKENKKRIILNLLNELQAGKEFNELAAKFSEDSAAQKKGHLGIIPEVIMEDDIRNAVNQLNDNEYTKEPVIAGKSFCLIKLHKRYNLTEKNIKSLVADKEKTERIIDFFHNRDVSELLDTLKDKKSIKSNIEKVNYNRDGEIIFSIDQENFTTTELEDILRLFYSLRYGAPSVKGFSLNEKKMTAKKIFEERLIASEAVRSSVPENTVFKRNWFYLKRATLAGAYKYDVLLKNLAVTKDDIMREYVQNKNSKYYKTKKLNNKDIKVVLAYDEVKVEIKNYLFRENLKALKKKWDKEILDEGGYEIVNKDFLIN